MQSFVYDLWCKSELKYDLHNWYALQNSTDIKQALHDLVITDFWTAYKRK